MGMLGSKVGGRRKGERGHGKPIKQAGRMLGAKVGGARGPKYMAGEEPESIKEAAALSNIEVVDEVIEAPITANLTELEAALKSNPAYYESLYQGELTREGGHRKGALRILLAHEEKHGNRADRITEINDLL